LIFEKLTKKLKISFLMNSKNKKYKDQVLINLDSDENFDEDSKK